MVLSCAALTDGGLHETGEGWENVDRRVDTLVVELTVNEDLTFRNVTSQIGDRMGNIWRS